MHQVSTFNFRFVFNECLISGQSKTLSFQIVLQNLQGPQLSTKPFCKRLPSIDPFFCLGSEYMRSEDIAYAFDRAIKRDQNYRQNRIATQCVSVDHYNYLVYRGYILGCFLG